MAGGRPVKITEELIKQICDVVRAGNYIETAAAFNGLSKSTLYDWMKRGARERQRIEGTNRKPLKKEELFMAFSDAIEKAMAEAEIRDVMRIGEASKSDWKAAAWRLERKNPQKWGRKFQQVESNEEETALKLELMRLQAEKARIELGRANGDGDDDAHELIAAYTEALKGNVGNAFADEVGEDDGSEEE